jgi:hypothetical protein
MKELKIMFDDLEVSYRIKLNSKGQIININNECPKWLVESEIISNQTMDFIKDFISEEFHSHKHFF